MKFTEAIRAGITAIMAPLFSLAFIGIPLAVGGTILVASADVLFMSA